MRVLGCDSFGSTESIVRGIDWVAQNASGPSVANLSLGGGVTQALDQAVARLVQRGVTAVIAAGNDGKDACQVSPAREPSGITVGATDSNDRRSYHLRQDGSFGGLLTGATVLIFLLPALMSPQLHIKTQAPRLWEVHQWRHHTLLGS